MIYLYLFGGILIVWLVGVTIVLKIIGGIVNSMNEEFSDLYEGDHIDADGPEIDLSGDDDEMFPPGVII